MISIPIYIVVTILLCQVESFRINPFVLKHRTFLLVPRSPLSPQHDSFRRPSVQASDCPTSSGTYGSTKENIASLINTLLLDTSLSAKQIMWSKDKLDITLVNTINGTEVSPNSDEIDSFHRSLHKGLESDARLADALETLDISVGSPGLGDVLQTDRDFETFKGFDVNVRTSEEHHKQTNLLGKLVERTKEYLFIMQKGRKLKIPRNIVVEVKMPPSLFEHG